MQIEIFMIRVMALVQRERIGSGMEVILLRHAEKALISGPKGPELTPGGHARAQVFAHTWLPQVQTSTNLLVVSEKIRTHQSLEPLAQALKVSLSADARLNEHTSRETESEFFQRIIQVQRHLESLASQYQNIFLCSHYDVLDGFVDVLAESCTNVFPRPYWRPLSHAHFVYADEKWQWRANLEIPGATQS